MPFLWLLYLALCNIVHVGSTLVLFERDDACTLAFGAGWSSDTCKPSSTLCCIESGQPYPQCRTGLGMGWCCVSDSSCYVDLTSVCSDPGSVPCSVASGQPPACCPASTTCAANFNITSSDVRCNIAASALLGSASSSSSSTSSATSTSSSTGSSSSTASTTASSASITASTTQSTNSTSAPAASQNNSKSSALSGGAIAGIVLGPTLSILIVGSGIWYILLRRNSANRPTANPPEMVGYPGQAIRYDGAPQPTPIYELPHQKPQPHPVEIGYS